MKSSNEKFDIDDAEIRKAFSRRIMQNAFRHRVDQKLGIDAVHVLAFQSQGLLGDIEPPPSLPGVLEALLDPEHAVKVGKPDGPLLFLEEGEQRHIISIENELLSHNRSIRCAALDYLKAEASAQEPRLTPWTAERLEELSDDIESEDISKWRNAVLRLVPLIREDFFSHLAGFQQLCTLDNCIESKRYCQLVMQPNSNALDKLRPPVWEPSQQQDEIERWIAEWSQIPDLKTAFSKYIDYCGYMPLCSKLGAGELVKQWKLQHPDGEVQWNQLWKWAEESNTPFAKYHAIILSSTI